MKQVIFSALAAALTLNAVLALAATGARPATLQCHIVSTISGSNFSDAAKVEKLTEVDTQTPVLDGISNGTVSVDAHTGRAVVDFSESDQFWFYTFTSDDLNALATGKVASIKGTVEDGFDWSNGYNVRGLFVTE